MLQREKNPVFKVVRLPENVGHGNARRASLENASNELIALMDADDISAPDRFEKQLKVFEENPDINPEDIGMEDDYGYSDESLFGDDYADDEE